MDVMFGFAAGVSALTLIVHVFAGGRSVARPLLDCALGDEARLTAYYCWHLTSLMIGTLSACFGWAALDPGAREVAIVATGLAGASAVWSGLLTVWKRQKVLTLPQWLLFVPIAALGIAGLV